MQLIILRGEVTEWLIFFDHPTVFKMFIKSRGDSHGTLLYCSSSQTRLYPQFGELQNPLCKNANQILSWRAAIEFFNVDINCLAGGSGYLL